MVATAAVDALIVAAALAGGLAVNGTPDLVHGSLVVGAVWVVIGPLGARAYVRRIVVEAAEEPASPVVARGPSRAVLVNGALLLAVAAILVAFDVLNAGFTGALFGVVLWQLTLAASVRRWERRTGRRTTRRDEGELSVERLGELWATSQEEFLGDS